ncbi:hypothetical protein OG21DRAFT_1107174 [Imleria badia]|nr:hypothetical protein OG21DRAFT_1107174 [Imleria badia]
MLWKWRAPMCMVNFPCSVLSGNLMLLSWCVLRGDADTYCWIIQVLDRDNCMVTVELVSGHTTSQLAGNVTSTVNKPERLWFWMVDGQPPRFGPCSPELTPRDSPTKSLPHSLSRRTACTSAGAPGG